MGWCSCCVSQNTETFLLPPGTSAHSTSCSTVATAAVLPGCAARKVGAVFGTWGSGESNPMNQPTGLTFCATITLDAPPQVEETRYRELQQIQCDPAQPWSRLRPAVPSRGREGRFTEKTFVIHLDAPPAYLGLPRQALTMRHFDACNGQHDAFDRCRCNCVLFEIRI